MSANHASSDDENNGGTLIFHPDLFRNADDVDSPDNDTLFTGEISAEHFENLGQKLSAETQEMIARTKASSSPFPEGTPAAEILKDFERRQSEEAEGVMAANAREKAQAKKEAAHARRLSKQPARRRDYSQDNTSDLGKRSLDRYLHDNGLVSPAGNRLVSLLGNDIVVQSTRNNYPFPPHEDNDNPRLPGAPSPWPSQYPDEGLLGQLDPSGFRFLHAQVTPYEEELMRLAGEALDAGISPEQFGQEQFAERFREQEVAAGIISPAPYREYDYAYTEKELEGRKPIFNERGFFERWESEDAPEATLTTSATAEDEAPTAELDVRGKETIWDVNGNKVFNYSLVDPELLKDSGMNPTNLPPPSISLPSGVPKYRDGQRLVPPSPPVQALPPGTRPLPEVDIGPPVVQGSYDFGIAPLGPPRRTRARPDPFAAYLQTTTTNTTASAGSLTQGAVARTGSQVLPDGIDPSLLTKIGRLVDVDDPFMCPHCFHAYKSKGSVKTHVKERHGWTKQQIAANPESQDPKTKSWFDARGIDTTYTGNERKQVNARRRMDLGLKTTDPQYWQDVYKNQPAERTANNKKLRKEQEDDGF